MNERCEPPPEWRDRDGWHWVQYKQSPMCRAEWSATEREWFFPEDQTHSPVESLSTSWRYLAPVTPPAVVAAMAEALELTAAAMDALHPSAAGDMSDGDYARLWNATREQLNAILARINGEARR